MSHDSTDALLTAEQILGADDLPSETISVPEWGGKVRVITMSGTDRDAFETDVIVGKGVVSKENIRAKLIARCLVDGVGKRIFTEEQITALGRKSSKALNRIFSVASRLNGLSKSDVGELAGN